jgi:two-component system, NtrC family, sensor histidine kinase PilS
MVSSADPALHRKLVWLAFFRIVTVTVLLAGAGAVSWQARGDAAAALAPLYVTIAAVYAVTIGISLGLRRRAAHAAMAYVQIALDVAVAAAVVACTGGSESVFVFMFSLGVVNGAILLFRRGALAGVGLAVVGYLVAVLGFSGPPWSWAVVLVHCSAFGFTGVLAAYLAEQLRTTTERLAARESDLAVITALHHSVVESLTSGLVTLDPASRITYMNSAAERITGVSLQAVRGRPVQEVVVFPAQGGREEIEFVNARRERIRLGYTVFKLRTREGQEMGTAAIFQDLTLLRTMEAAMQRSERLADLGRVAAGLAHELRNPLASMSGSVELLRARTPAGGDERRLLDIVLREAERLDQLVRAFLSYARPPPLRRQRTDLAALLGETLDVFTHDPDAASVGLARDLLPAWVECDADQIRQVAWNLLKNAAQARATVGPGGRIEVSCGSEAGGCWFRVHDDGPGIPAADRERIFLPFHTTKERGTGLGLAIVHRIVDEHGGRVEVEGPPAGGTSFVVHLVEAPAVRAVG